MPLITAATHVPSTNHTTPQVERPAASAFEIRAVENGDSPFDTDQPLDHDLVDLVFQFAADSFVT